MGHFDKLTERMTRSVARNTSRRSLLTLIGGVVSGGAIIPVLPLARAHASEPEAVGPSGLPPQYAANPQDPGDNTSCDYWRYCAVDGFLCSCCGGTVNSCPPGTEMSPITWIGTCRNPADNRAYIISYNDCCGKTSCGRCACTRNEGDKPTARAHESNDINWCLGTESSIFHCSTAIILGVAVERP